MRRLALLLSGSLTCATTGCSTWALAPAPDDDPPAYRQYQVWTADSALHLQGIRIQNDTLYGVPLGESHECRRCSIALPIAAVDSLRTSHTEHVGSVVLGAAAGGVSAILLLIALLAGDRT